MAKRIIENTKNSEVKNNNITKAYKKEKCKVLSYNSKTRELDIDFKGYGMRLHNIDNPNTEFIYLNYSSDIGQPDFKCYV